MAALENAVASNARHEEIRHRMNVSAEGNWFLLANIITITAAYGLFSNKKSQEG